MYEFTLPESVYYSQFTSVSASYQQITESLKQEFSVRNSEYFEFLLS